MATGKVLKTVGEINALLNAIENAPNIYTTPAQVEAQVEEGVAHLAEKDGSYPLMSVGFAEHLVGDGTATSEEFSFRPTAGVDRNVETTTYDYDMRSNFGARIKSVKGNSVVWNQQVDIPSAITSVYNKNWINYATYSINGDVLSINVTSAQTAASNYLCGFRIETREGGHRYAAFLKVRGSFNKAMSVRAYPWYLTGTPINVKESWSGAMSILNAATSSTENTFYITIATQDGTSRDVIAGDYIELRKPTLIDLTQMFGAGNEPTTVEEFYARLPKGVDINAYNEGEIVDANYEAIKTTGFNQYNGTFAKVLGGYAYYLGGTYTSVGFTTEEGGTTEAITIPSDKLYTPSQNGYIYAEGSEICINLAWDEYASLNGTYKPYKPFERDLSWVAQYFPEGMRRAGDISDEIRFNSTTQKWEAVQNVDVRAYASGDEYYTTFITDGTNTNYPLATPIVTEIEETPNLDYDVADYGTEELIVADGVKSAPFLGDIIYTPNAEKTLWQVPDILKRLTALEAAVASATTTE